MKIFQLLNSLGLALLMGIFCCQGSFAQTGGEDELSYRDQVQIMYVAYYGRPGDAGGLDFWAGELEEVNGNLMEIIDSFGNSMEFTERFGDLDDEELVNNIFLQLLGKNADSGGLNFYLNGLREGRFTLATIALNVADGTKEKPEGRDNTVKTNKLRAANAFSEAYVEADAPYGEFQIDDAKLWLGEVDSTEASVTAALDRLPDLLEMFSGGMHNTGDMDDDNDGISDNDDPCPLDRDNTCLPLLDISGSLYVDPDILTPSDPTTFHSVTYTGRGDRVMFDRRQDQFVTYNAFLFDAAFTDGFSLEIQVNPEFQTSDAARHEAETYGWLIGQLPRALRQPDFQMVWIHKGVEPFGGRNNNVLIHTGQADLWEAEGILEEALIHEGAHTSLDSRHASSSGWAQAQQDDMDFISTYAKDYPTREDLAESFPMWMALRYRADRISPRLAATIRARMPHRLAYLDAQNFDMAPVR